MEQRFSASGASGVSYTISLVEIGASLTLVAQGRITPVVNRIFPLEDVELAFEALRQGTSMGRNVLTVG